MSDLDLVQGTLEGMLHSVGASNLNGQLKRTLRRFEVATRVSSATNASTLAAANANVSERLFFRVPVACKVVSAHYTADGANIAGDNTNVRSIALKKRAGTAYGDTAATVADLALNVANAVTMWVPKALTVTAAQAQVAANSLLTWDALGNSSTIAAHDTGGTLVVTFEEL